MMANALPKPETIMECDFHPVKETDVLHWVSKIMKSDDRGYITTVNVAILMMMRRNVKLRKFIKNSSLRVADGQPIIWLSKLIGKPLPERVTGVDLCESLAAYASRENKSIFLFGATNSVLTGLRRYLLTQYPNLNIVGSMNGYFSDHEAAKRADMIKESQADILLVAMGVPRQENFLYEYWDRLDVKITIPVGGSFDVLSGKKKRAPKWMQGAGLEWLFRFMQEPKRLFKRYAQTNTQFMVLSIKELLGGKA